MNSLREISVGNHSATAFDHYDYTSHKLDNSDTYAIGTGYNEKQNACYVHSSGEGSQTSKTIHVFESSKCLNHVTKIKEYFDNLTSTEYFTGTWTTDNNRDMDGCSW